MPDKKYKFKNVETEITGTDELIAFIDDVFAEYEDSKTKLENQPSLEAQLAVFDKAKPYLQQAKVKVEDYYKQPVIEVMKTALASGNIKTDNATDEIIKYLFENVLPTYTTPTESDKNKQSSSTGTTTKPNGVKPVGVSGTGMSSEELGDAIAKSRLNGSVANK